MHVTPLTEPMVRDWLTRHGVRDVNKVMNGIDKKQPMYLRRFHPQEKLVQYRDRPSADFPDGAMGGQWFALPSVRPDSIGQLGIGSGLAGRSHVVLTVVRPFEALETTATSMNQPGKPLYDRYIGPGGATQVFIPDEGRSALR